MFWLRRWFDGINLATFEKLSYYFIFKRASCIHSVPWKRSLVFKQTDGGEKNLHSYSWKPANQITSCQIVKVLSSYVCSICVRLWVCSLTHWKYSTIGLLTVSKHKTGIWKSIITLTKLLTSASSTEMTDGLKDTIYIIHLYRKTSRGSVGVISRLMDFLLTDQKGTTPPW